MFRSGKFALAAVFSLAVSHAHSAPLFQSVPDLTAAPFYTRCSSCDGSFRVFDTFTLASESTIQSITFILDTTYNFPTTTNVSIWSLKNTVAPDPIGRPNQELVGGNFDASLNYVVTVPGSAAVTISTGGWTLPAGTYDISIYSPVALATRTFLGGSGLLYQQGTDVFWTNESLGFALNGDIEGAVPIPGALPLFATGLGALGFAAWRRKKKAANMAA